MGTKSNQKFTRNGFTIVELLVVIVVIAILAAVTIVAYSGIRDRANDAAAKSALASTLKKIETYRLDPSNAAQAFPSSLTDIGVTSSGGTTLTYSSVNDGSYYCLESRNGSTIYHQTSVKPNQVTGPCPTTNGLIAWWPLNGDAKNYITGDVGAVVSNATPAVGQNGLANGSYSFTGNTNSNINTNHISNRNVFSFSLWTYPTNISGYRAALSEARDCCGSGYRGIDFKTSYSTAGAASIGLWAGGSGAAQWVAGATTVVDTWNFYSGTYDGSVISFYKDGALVSSVNYVGSPGDPINPLYIARAGGTAAGAFAGRIDDVRIYNRALTAQEMATLYAVGAQ